MTSHVINTSALEPLFGPADVPLRHRVRSKTQGAPAEIVQGRRPSPLPIVQSLRASVATWRKTEYAGASDTTRELLYHWFHTDHRVASGAGDTAPFAYYFCQREAVETLIYLHEVRGIQRLSSLTAQFGSADPHEAELAALGISPDEDQWARFAFKIATGAGKMKIMSLAIVWSYFHALRESDSPLTRHFVVIAPGVTVFERLKEDFADGKIFYRDPLIPAAWRGDWNLSVVLQDEAGGAASGGTLYLTNIHRLYEKQTRRRKEVEEYDWAGPKVSTATALDTSKALRERITSHPRLMVLNDEAHHVWDPDSAWNEAITHLHETTRKRGGGLVAQLDFSATPKDADGNAFRHVVCDTPLGEAVDAGIVKTPIIGHGERLVERAHEDASYRYENHLLLGYNRWLISQQEWAESGRKALLFVMTEDTKQADDIARRLNSDPAFQELNGKTINLHTNLKGKLVQRGKGATAYYEFKENEKEINDDDLKALRKLSRELDDSTSPYRCIVSVLMLREGWDVRNVTTIVPLRPLTAKSRILPEQTLGRGLRRMTPPGEVAEVVAVVEHKAFTDLYREQLSQEGLQIEETDLDKIPRTTVTIYPDREHKDLKALDLVIPQLSQAYQIVPELGDLSFDDVLAASQTFKHLPLGQPEERETKYEGRHLITNEVVEQMQVKLPLLKDGMGAVSFFREELERTVKIRGTHARLAPLVQRFLEERLFEEKVTVYDPRLLARLGDPDVREHIRATFVPLLLKKITQVKQRLGEAPAVSVCDWKPYAATHSERRPAQRASRTPFNLVPCNRQLEVAFAYFADQAGDVVTFAKNAGPQALRIDYLTKEGRRAIYTPDFLVRTAAGRCFLVETKGREDRDVPAKARAAVEWCKAAATKAAPWEYLYVPEDVFDRATCQDVAELARACAPALEELLAEARSPQMLLPFTSPEQQRKEEHALEFIEAAALAALPQRYRQAIEHAVSLFKFHEKKSGVSFAPVFQPLLGPIDSACEALLLERLLPGVPAGEADQKDYFEPDMSGVKKKNVEFLTERARTLKRLLVHRGPLMPTGVLVFCLEYALGDSAPAGGIFTAVRTLFADLKDGPLRERVQQAYEFRNTYIAHEKQPLVDAEVSRGALRQWIEVLQSVEGIRRR
jgi:type III restriction enzyme